MPQLMSKATPANNVSAEDILKALLDRSNFSQAASLNQQDKTQQVSNAQRLRPSLNPIAQAAEEGAIKATKEQAYNAVLEGGPDVAMHISQQYGSGTQSQSPVDTLMGMLPPRTPAGDISLKINGQRAPVQQDMVQAPVGAQPAIAQSGESIEKYYPKANKNPVNTLFNMIGFGQSPDAIVANTAYAKTAQEMAGNQPLQAGEREKLGMGYVKDIAVKQLELAAKQAENGNLKPEHLFNKFETASTPFITARDAHARLEESAKEPSAAGDLSMLYNFMKVLDPGSTIRESEFATAAASGSIPEQMKGAWSKVISGKRLSPEVRADFLSRSRKIFKGMENQQMKTTSEFKNLAKKNGINWENIIADKGLAQASSPSEKKIQQIGRFQVEVH